MNEILLAIGSACIGAGVTIAFYQWILNKATRQTIEFIRKEWTKYCTNQPNNRAVIYNKLVSHFGQRVVDKALPDIKRTGV